MKKYFIYIVDNGEQKLSTGLTSYVTKKLYENLKTADGRTGLGKLVYIEEVTSVAVAIKKEKVLKKSRNIYKIELIKSQNPTWENLIRLK